MISSYETSVPEATGSVYYKHAFVYMHDGIIVLRFAFCGVEV